MKSWWKTLAVGTLFGMGHNNAEAQEIPVQDNTISAPVEAAISDVWDMSSTNRNDAIQGTIISCMAAQQSHPSRISQKYGLSSEDIEKYGDNVPPTYGALMEWFAGQGDKELGKVLGLPEEQMTPKNMIFALAYGPRLDENVCKEIYEHACTDGRWKKYTDNFADLKIYPEIRLGDRRIINEDAARIGVSIIESMKMSTSIINKYGDNATALLVRGLRGDKELAKQFGYGDEKVDAQQLVYMLACRNRIPDEVQNNMISEHERKEADQVIATIYNRKLDGKDTFVFNPRTQNCENGTEAVISAVQAHNEYKSKLDNVGNSLYQSDNKQKIAALRGVGKDKNEIKKQNIDENRDLMLFAQKKLIGKGKQ